MSMTEVVEESLKADARFRHLTVMPTHFLFEAGGKRCIGKYGEAYVGRDSAGIVRTVVGSWREMGNESRMG